MESAATIGSGIEIRASTIPGGGNGLFTSRLFHKNELITEYFGPIIDHEKAKKLRKQNKHSHVRVLTIQFQYIDGIKQPRPGVGGASFANDARDSQKNNAVFVCRHDHKLGRDRVYLKATRELPPGTEVFVGYGRNYWRNSKKPPASPPKQQPAKQLRCDSEQEAESPQQEQHQHMRTRSGGRKHPQQQQQQQRVQEEQQEQETQAKPPLQPPARLMQEALVQADRKQAAAAAAAGGAAVAAAQRHVLPIPKQQPAAGHIPVRNSSRVKQKCQQQEQEQQQAAAAAVAIVQQQQQEERQQQEQDSDKASLLQAPAQLVQELPVPAVSRQAAAADAAAAIEQLQLLATQHQQQQPAAGHMQICSSPTIQRSPQQKQQQAAAAAVVQQPEQQAAVAAAPVVQKQKQQAAVAATAVVQQQQAQLARSTMQPDPVRTAAAAQAAALQLHGQLAPPPQQQQQQQQQQQLVGHSDTQLDPAAAAAAAAPVAAVQAALLQLHQQQAQQPAQLVLPMQPGAGLGPVFVPLGGNLALAGFVPLLPLCSTPLLAGAVPFGYVIAPQQLNPFVQHAASRTNPRFMFMGVNVPRRQRSTRASRTSSVVPAAAATLLQPWQVAAALAAPVLHQQQQQRKERRQGSFDSSEAENSTAVDPDWVQGQREGEETAAAAGQKLSGSGENPSMQLAARHADSGFSGLQIPRRQRSTRAGRAGSGGYASSGGTQRPLKRSCVSVYRDKRRSVTWRFVAAKRPCVAAEQVPEADAFEGNPYRRVYTHTRCKAAALHDVTDEDSSEEDSTSSEEEEDVGEADTPTAVGAAAAPAAAAAALPAAVAAASGDVEGVSRSAGRRPSQKRSRAPRAMNAAAAEDCPPEVQQLLDEGNPYKRVYRRNWPDLQDADAGGDVDGDADWEPDGDADEDATDREPGSQCHVAGGHVVSSSANRLSQKRSYVSNHKAKANGVVEECAPKVQEQPDEVNPYKKVYRRSWGGAQDGDAGMPTGGRGCGTPAGRRRRVASGGGVDSSGGRWQLQARSCASVYRAE